MIPSPILRFKESVRDRFYAGRARGEMEEWYDVLFESLTLFAIHGLSLLKLNRDNAQWGYAFRRSKLPIIARLRYFMRYICSMAIRATMACYSIAISQDQSPQYSPLLLFTSLLLNRDFVTSPFSS